MNSVGVDSDKSTGICVVDELEDEYQIDSSEHTKHFDVQRVVSKTNKKQSMKQKLKQGWQLGRTNITKAIHVVKKANKDRKQQKQEMQGVARLSRKSRTQQKMEDLVIGSSISNESEFWEDELVAPIINPTWKRTNTCKRVKPNQNEATFRLHAVDKKSRPCRNFKQRMVRLQDRQERNLEIRRSDLQYKDVNSDLEELFRVLSFQNLGVRMLQGNDIENSSLSALKPLNPKTSMLKVLKSMSQHERACNQTSGDLTPFGEGSVSKKTVASTSTFAFRKVDFSQPVLSQDFITIVIYARDAKIGKQKRVLACGSVYIRHLENNVIEGAIGQLLVLRQYPCQSQIAHKLLNALENIAWHRGCTKVQLNLQEVQSCKSVAADLDYIFPHKGDKAQLLYKIREQEFK